MLFRSRQRNSRSPPLCHITGGFRTASEEMDLLPPPAAEELDVTNARNFDHSSRGDATTVKCVALQNELYAPVSSVRSHRCQEIILTSFARSQERTINIYRKWDSGVVLGPIRGEIPSTAWMFWAASLPRRMTGASLSQIVPFNSP